MKHLLFLILIVLFPVSAPAQTKVPDSQNEILLSFAPLVRSAGPAVVNIFARKPVARQSPLLFDDPFFGPFFSGLTPPRRVQNSLGSGVILSSDGLVVSNFHVVGNATDILVALPDRREFAARVVLADEGADLAILQLEDATGLPFLEIVDSDLAEVGDLVLAIGNPFGAGQTVTSGIVSALARGGVGGRTGHLIQTDAAINPGNSGGALLGMDGKLLGVNTSILMDRNGATGIGFAIPGRRVAAYLHQAKNGANRFIAPWSGLRLQEIDSSLADALGMSATQGGVLLADIHPQSPFGAAGLRVGDVLMQIDGSDLFSAADFEYRLSLYQIGQTVAVRYISRGRDVVTQVELQPTPESAEIEIETLDGAPLWAGLLVSTLDTWRAQEMGLPVELQGVIVEKVSKGSRRLNLKVGDVILAVNGEVVRTVADLRAITRRDLYKWAVRIRRGNKNLAMVIVQ